MSSGESLASRELRREIAEHERRRVRSAVELASRIAGREVTHEELRERGAQRSDEFYALFRDRA